MTQHRSFTGAIAIEQPVIEALQELALRLGIAGNAEIGHHEIEKLGHVHARVEDEGGGHLLQAEPFHQFIDQRGLARAHLAGKQHEALAALYAVGEAGQRLFGVPRQEQVTRVRIDVERVGAKSKKFFIHRLALDLDLLVVLGRSADRPGPRSGGVRSR